MTRLNRDKRTGDYYTADRKYQIEKGTTGWNVNELDPRGWYSYSYSCDTLREARESIENAEGESQKGQNTMKQYYITSNVNDRNATAKSLANGEKFDVWFTPSTVRHYDEKGDLICTESSAMNWDEVERIDPTENKTVYVGFNFGSYVYLTVTIHEGLTLDECVCLRGRGDIESYRTESGEWVNCTADFDATLEKLQALRERPDETETTESTEGGEESAPTFTIAHNDEYNGTEISFPGKPSEEVRGTLKALGFRWHGQKKVWYGYKDEQTVRAAIEGKSQPMTAHKGRDTKATKPAEKSNKFGVRVGDMFYASWGYEQTNVDFFQVVALVGELSVRVRQVYPPMVRSEAVSSMSQDSTYSISRDILPPADHSVFIEDQEHGDLKRLKSYDADGKSHPQFNLSSFANAYFCEPGEKKCYESWYC